MPVDAEGALKALVRAELPPAVFRRHRARVLLGLPIVAIIVGGSLLVAGPAPVYALPVLYLIIANAYVTLMFFGHEVGHGAMGVSSRVQTGVLFVTGAVFLVSPHLWRHWHDRVHHPHANVPGLDPDRYDSLDELQRTWRPLRWLTVRLAPGSGHWLSVAYLPLAFTVHGQVVLWVYSRRARWPGFRWGRAVGETALIAGAWTALGAWLGAGGALLVIVVPMLLANAVVMSYVATNHMLRPLSARGGALTTALSLTSPRLVDAVHLHFSHHVEHHLFPGLSHRHYPLVRAALRRHAGPAFVAPTHWGALRVLWTTPRHYAAPDVLANPLTGARVALREVEMRLRAADPALAGRRAAGGA